jgi:predicted SprT family Zn-dependent metalloprotease
MQGRDEEQQLGRQSDLASRRKQHLTYQCPCDSLEERTRKARTNQDLAMSDQQVGSGEDRWRRRGG